MLLRPDRLEKGWEAGENLGVTSAMTAQTGRMFTRQMGTPGTSLDTATTKNEQVFCTRSQVEEMMFFSIASGRSVLSIKNRFLPLE